MTQVRCRDQRRSGEQFDLFLRQRDVDSAKWRRTSYGPPNFQYTTSAASTIPVTVQGNPAGVSFSVDGTAYTTAQGFNWTSGSQHTIATTSPQGTGTQYVFTSWSDGGAISHTVSPTSGTTYTANFTASSGGGGGATAFITGTR